MRLPHLAGLVFFLSCLFSIVSALPVSPPGILLPRSPVRPSSLNKPRSSQQARQDNKRDNEMPTVASQATKDLAREYVFYAGNTYCTNLAIGAKVGKDGTVLATTGNGINVQQVFVAYSPTLGIVVSHQGTNKTSFTSVANDIKFRLTAPWKGLDWLEPGVKIGNGFQEVWDDTAQWVLDEVRKAKNQHPAASISTTGHSLGGSTSLLSALHLSHNLNTAVKVIAFGMPRTGNKKFANVVDKLLPDQQHVVHFQDPVPQMPPKTFGFRHPSGEIWIADEKGDIVYMCGGQENKMCSDSVSFFNYRSSDHSGPYFHVTMDCTLK